MIQPTVMFPGFETRKIQTTGATIHTLLGGSGPPLLLLHGYPQTHVEWHKIGLQLAERFSVRATTDAGYRQPPPANRHGMRATISLSGLDLEGDPHTSAAPDLGAGER